ncbi:MAG: YdeI/OmpD-associated family protein [Bacteroidota bacterium]
MPSALDSADRVEVTSRAAWRAWLAAHHTQPDGIWLVTYKKHTGGRYVDYDSIVEEALCFGWIDSLPRKLDADRTMLYVSPRKPGSIWSRLNKQRIEALEADGRMTEIGRAKIEAAKADGSWTLYDDVENLVIPDDLAAALASAPAAEAAFDGFSASSKKGVLWWIKSAKRDATRAKRIAETVRLAALGVVANTPMARGR